MMTLRDNHTVMKIECDVPVACDVPYSISVNVLDQFEAHCHNLYFMASSKLSSEFDAFMKFELNEFEIKIYLDGFIHLTREATGGIKLHYEFEDPALCGVCKISGEIKIDGEFSSSVLKDLKKTVFSKVLE